MKKILSGFWYRFLRGYEIWGLIVLLVFAQIVLTAFIFDENNIMLSRNDYTYYVGTEDGEIAVNSENYKDYRFESTGVSAYDAWRYNVETISEDAHEKMDKSIFWYDEMSCLYSVLTEIHVFPALLMVIFIPLFFGKLFGDHTVKNLLASGHSKGRIYLASLLFTFILNALMIAIGMIVFTAYCLFYMWKPPVYLPIVLVMLLLEIFMVCTVSSVSIAVLFASEKTTASFAAGFAAVILMFIPISSFLIMNLCENDQQIDDESDAFAEYMAVTDSNHLEYRMDLSEFKLRISYEGKELDIYKESGMSPVERTVSLAVIYSDPFMVFHFGKEIYIEPFIMYRDGLLTVNIISNIFWIMFSSFAGSYVFRKRDII